MRLWIESQAVSNKLKIAKIEIVGNEWEELGSTVIDSISYSDSFLMQRITDIWQNLVSYRG